MRAAFNASRAPFAIAFAVYSALAIALTYPLLLHLPSVVPHDAGDPMLSTSILWWNAHVLPFTERWWNGFAFYPAKGFLALSDPRVGESLLATPLQWLGCSPVTAYNLTFLATYPLCALAAHWLGFVLTRRHDAAAIAGLAYGFSPFRVAHIPHLELLAGFGMPVALASLHLYTETRRPRWLVVFAAAIVVQGLCSSYYLAFFSVLLGMWLLWFIRRENVRALGGIVIAGVFASVALLPLALGYSRIHRYYDFGRKFWEVVMFSADGTSLLTAHPLVALWGWTGKWARPEGELFPGATIVLLTLAGSVLAWRRGSTRDRLDRASRWLLPVAGVATVIAVCGWAYAPWRIVMLGVSLSSDSPFKPMTVALFTLTLWLAASSPMRAAYARQSAFAFYAIAAAALFVCSLGPEPAFAGHRFLYESPYRWLMHLPVFASIRVPARFGLPAMLGLAIAAAVAFDEFTLRPAARRALGAAVLIAVVADGWVARLPLAPIPDNWPASNAAGFAAVLELPLGDTFGDLAAIYRGIDHGHPVVNGNSGFEPTHYFTLRNALDERDPTALDGLPPTGRILGVVDTRAADHLDWDRYLMANPRVTKLAPDGHWAFYAIDPPPALTTPCSGDSARIVSITGEDGPIDLPSLTDGNPHTFWAASHPQRAGDNLVVDLGRVLHPCALTLAVGEFGISYPRKLIVETSVDREAWTMVASGRLAGSIVAAALQDPKQVAVTMPLTASTGRFVRLRADEAHPKIAWQVTDVSVRVSRSAE